MLESRRASRGKDFAAGFGLLVLNVAVFYPLFQGQYTQYTSSVEPVYMAVARFIAQHPPCPTWNPLWYGGYPFRIFYTPVLPYTLALSHAITSLSIPAAYRLITASLYVLTPVTWYALVLYLTRRRSTAIVAALVYSLLPSFVYLIPEVRNVAQGFGYAPWRLLVLVLYGEGPHTCALAFTPLAALLFLRALRKPKLANYLGAALSMGFVALINFVALFALGMILAAILVTEMVVGEPTKKLKSAVISVVLAYGLSAFWLNISFIKASFSFGTGSQVLHNLTAIWPLLLLLLPLCGVLFVPFSGRHRLQPLLLACFWLATIGLIVFSWYSFHWVLAPQPNRYMPELDMAFTLLVGLAVTRMYDLLTSGRRRAAPAILAVVGLIVLTGILAFPFLRVSRTITRPRSAIVGTIEYQIARWFAEHTEEHERVYVTGNTTFWLNLFSDVAQVRGGLDQSATNPWWQHAAYQINAGDDGSLGVLWAKAFNVRYILVNYPESSDPFHDYVHPNKFEGLLEPVHSRAASVIFEVPPASGGLVQIVSLARLRALPPIDNGADKESLQAYVDVVEGGRNALNTLDSVDRVSIDADVRLGEAILVRMTYDPGWRASAAGTALTVRPDPLGFMIIEPDSPGEYEITLQHGRVWDEYLGGAVSGLTVVGVCAYAVHSRRARSKDPDVRLASFAGRITPTGKSAGMLITLAFILWGGLYGCFLRLHRVHRTLFLSD